MKAAIYQGKENIEIKELPNPVCTACTSRHLTNAAVTEHLCEVRNSMESIQGGQHRLFSMRLTIAME